MRVGPNVCVQTTLLPSLPRRAPYGHTSLTPATIPRLALQLQWAGGRGGHCAIIGTEGSDEPPVDRRQVAKKKTEKRMKALLIKCKPEIGGGSN